MSRRKIDLGSALRDVGDRYVSDHPADFEEVRRAVLNKGRWRVWTWGAGAVVVAGIVALVVLTVRFDPAEEGTLPPADAPASDLVETIVDLPFEVEQVSSSGETAFVAGGSSVARVEVSGSGSVWTQDVGGAPGEIAGSAGEVWVTIPETRQLLSLDPATGAITSTVDLSVYGTPRAFMAGASRVSIVIDDYGIVVLDRATRQLSELYRGAVVDVAQGAHAFWILTENGEILPLDRETGAVIGEIAPVTGLSPEGEITFTRQALWYGSYEENRIVRINEGRGGITHAETLPGSYVDLTGGSERLWLVVALDDERGQLMRLDPGNAEHVDDPVPLGGSPTDLSSDGDVIWVVVGPEGRLVHLQP